MSGTPFDRATSSIPADANPCLELSRAFVSTSPSSESDSNATFDFFFGFLTSYQPVSEAAELPVFFDVAGFGGGGLCSTAS